MRMRLLILLLILGACQNNNIPAGILSHEKMQAVFYDYISAEVYVDEYVASVRTRETKTESIKIQKQIFNKHKVTRKQFYDSYQYYIDHPSEMRDVIDTMLKRNGHEKLPTKKLRILDKQYE